LAARGRVEKKLTTKKEEKEVVVVVHLYPLLGASHLTPFERSRE
jgi:hypothetical protein